MMKRNLILAIFVVAVIGGGIFLLITLIGGLIAGKEAMGMGDVKLMGALGLYFGLQSIVAISVMSFLIGAIGSIVYMIINRKNADAYIPFGPFIVASSVITIFVPFVKTPELISDCFPVNFTITFLSTTSQETISKPSAYNKLVFVISKLSIDSGISISNTEFP